MGAVLLVVVTASVLVLLSHAVQAGAAASHLALAPLFVMVAVLASVAVLPRSDRRSRTRAPRR